MTFELEYVKQILKKIEEDFDILEGQSTLFKAIQHLNQGRNPYLYIAARDTIPTFQPIYYLLLKNDHNYIKEQKLKELNLTMLQWKKLEKNHEEHPKDKAIEYLHIVIDQILFNTIQVYHYQHSYWITKKLIEKLERDRKEIAKVINGAIDSKDLKLRDSQIPTMEQMNQTINMQHMTLETDKDMIEKCKQLVTEYEQKFTEIPELLKRVHLK